MYQVTVRNEVTGEVRTLEVSSSHATDAQITALQRLFKEDGWRRAKAMPALAVLEPSG